MKHRAKFGGLFLGFLIIFACLCVYIFQDEFKARDFILSGELSSVTSSLKLTDRANLILRATHPELQDKKSFNQNCNSHSQEIYVLGCYREDQDRLYVYNVNSSELPGVREVTTAHEMLHAAYHRLLFWEKLNLKDQLQSVYDSLPADSDLRTSMQNYRPDEFMTSSTLVLVPRLKTFPRLSNVITKDTLQIVNQSLVLISNIIMFLLSLRMKLIA